MRPLYLNTVYPNSVILAKSKLYLLIERGRWKKGKREEIDRGKRQNIVGKVSEWRVPFPGTSK